MGETREHLEEYGAAGMVHCQASQCYVAGHCPGCSTCPDWQPDDEAPDELPMMTPPLYAVKVRGDWYLARSVPAERFGEPRPPQNIPADTRIWSEHRSTAWLCKEGEEESLVLLTPGSARQGGGPDHWSVTVRRNGEEVVTIESNMLSGREISSGDEEAIRTAALHLLAFIGDGARIAMKICNACNGNGGFFEVEGKTPLEKPGWRECRPCDGTGVIET